MKQVELDRETFQAVTALLADHPELTPARLRELVEANSNGQRRLRAEPVRPRTVAEVVSLLEAKAITRAEARRYMRLR
jgi:hypothetical protein